MSRILFVLVPGVHLLDLAGPATVFSIAADFGHDYTLGYVAEQSVVPSAQGLPLLADTEWPEPGVGSGEGPESEMGADSGSGPGPEDMLLVPGWSGTTLDGGDIAPGPEVLRRLRAHHDAGGTVASVCAGADALGRAGLLDGRRCTTHHDLQDALATRYPRATVVRDVLFTVDDRVVTSAGIASGIDLALHLVALRHGPAVAAQIAREMVVFARRNGHEQQHSAMLRHRAHLDDTVHRAQDVIDTHYDTRLPLSGIAAAVGVSERTLTRQFSRATGLTPLRYQQTLRLERAEHLIAHGSTVELAARAVGFEDPRMLRRLRSRPVSIVPAGSPG